MIHGTWTQVQLNTCKIVASGSHHIKNLIQKNIKIGDGKYIQAIGTGNIDILTFNGKEWV